MLQKLEEKIKYLEARCAQLESILACVPGHIYWKDKSGTYLGCNDQQAKSLGYSSGKQLIGKTDFNLYSTPEAQTLYSLDQEVINTNQLIKRKETSTLANGEKRTFLSKKQPLYDYSTREIQGIIGTSVDITDTVEADRLKQENEAAQKTIELLKTLAGCMAHELKTPLSTMHLFVERLSILLPTLIYAYTLQQNKHSSHGVNLTDKDLEWLNTAAPTLEQCLRVASVMIEMQLESISFEKIDARLFCACAMSKLILEAIHTYPFKTNQRKLITIDIDQDFTFLGDANLMKHILWNLIKNALYFIQEQHRGVITIQLTQTPSNNVLIFKDTAKGIPSEIKENIFQPFFTRRSNGTGLGLPFCRNVMQAFKGTITCNSKEGKFTEFVLNFPKYREHVTVSEFLINDAQEVAAE